MLYQSLAIQIVIIYLLSCFANYHIPDVSQINWDIALFLTPYGIVNNFLNRNTSVMWSFYTDISKGQLQLNQNQIILMSTLYVFLIFNLLCTFKKKPRNK